MSEPYTPPTSEVRGAYQSWNQDIGGDPYMPEQSGAEFDRWLAKARADAWDEGNRFGIAKHCESGCYEDRDSNPYRQEAER